MRLLYLSDQLTVHDYRFLSKLAVSGRDVVFVTYRARDLPANIAAIRGIRVIHRPFIQYPQDRVGLRARHKWLRVLSQRLELTHAIIDFHRLVRLVSPDLIQAGVVHNSGLIATLSGWRPILLMPWGSDILVSPDQSFIHKQVIRYVISQVQAIGCDCQHVKKKILALTRYPNQRIWVIPWGIELSRFHPMPTSNRGKVRRRLGWEDKKILIMTRNLWDVYGHRFLIDALPAILQAEPDTRLILCGAGYLERELQERVRALDLNGYVHFAGFVPNEELPLYLNDSNVYVSPSLSDGTSASLLEAMACGLPVVVTDVPAILEWVTPDYNGLVVQRQDAVALAESLIRILRDETIREEMGKRNLVISCDRADWNKNFVEFENLYDHLADEYSSLRGRKAGRAIPCVF